MERGEYEGTTLSQNEFKKSLLVIFLNLRQRDKGKGVDLFREFRDLTYSIRVSYYHFVFGKKIIKTDLFILLVGYVAIFGSSQ